MPDLSPLPPLRPAPAFAPDPRRFERTAALARRRRAARGVPVGAALAAVVALGAVDGPAGTGGLDAVSPAGRSAHPATTAPDEPSPAGRPESRPDGRDDRPGRGPGPAGVGVVTPDPLLPTTTGSPPPPHTPDPSPCPSPWVEVEPNHPEDDWRCQYTPPTEQATLAAVAFDPTAGCESYHVDDSPGWCLRSRNARTVASGATMTIVLEACRPTTAGRVTFPDAVEVIINGHFVGKPGFDRVFPHRWSSQPGAGAHDLTVEAGTCARWTAGWRAVSPSGNDLPPGEYRVNWSYRPPQDGVRPMAEWTLTVE